jgi:hypothetical protein
MPECSDAGVGVYDVAWHGGGFVFYAGAAMTTARPAGLSRIAPGQRRLTMRIVEAGDLDRPRGGALFDAVDRAVRSKQGYTMGQIQAIGRDAGARTKLGAADDVSCACRLYGQTAG